MLNKTKNLILKFLPADMIRFLFAGGCSTLIDFVIYMVLSEIMLYNTARAVSLMTVAVFSYIVGKEWTFKYKKKASVGHFMKYLITLTANLATNFGLNYFLYSNTGNKIMSYMIAVICAMTINYLLQRFFVFKG